MNNRLLSDYLSFLVSVAGNDYADNFDSSRFGAEPRDDRRLRSRVSARLSHLLARAGFARTGPLRLVLKTGIDFIDPALSDLEWLYENLQDRESQDLLVRVIAYRALGHRKVKLPLNTSDYWRKLGSLEGLARNAESAASGFRDFELYNLDLASHGYPIRLFATPKGALAQFVLEQYRCNTQNGTIEAGPSDVVIDAGGCWGDTALYFAAKVGAGGRVLTFEFLPDNLVHFHRNIAQNPTLAKDITLIQRPVWCSSGTELFVNGSGPSTWLSSSASSPAATPVRTITIDEAVERENLERVDFVKMDIEGAEMSALQGAERTLRKFRPKVAIAVYHRLSDFWSVPRFLDSLDVGYRYYLRHFTIHAEETVLFAQPAPQPG